MLRFISLIVHTVTDVFCLPMFPAPKAAAGDACRRTKPKTNTQSNDDDILQTMTVLSVKYNRAFCQLRALQYSQITWSVYEQ